ncbi:SWIM zinc finger family protein [Methylomicrobium sp. Wu6]|uniref:SWIM zinc finger family protein n=1 Tax=Methylomicrobium sp. Wu6 TaxID=3107928 RepID=UPI002DD64F7B|nr:SWIM zinc finger family protein [Methylomicrobium sp. Wu6]MEC4749052.1 SWIM zinc finger family protein [Methylomicrobium sp. Wu6]
MRTLRTRWGQRFIEALESFTDSARLARGRGYANNDRIRNWKRQGSLVSATIRGNINPYYGVYKEPLYKTSIVFQSIDAEQWQQLIQMLGSRAAFISRLLLNEVPDNIEDVFRTLKLNLLPYSHKDLKTDCSCPDYANPCKHIAGLYYFLAAQLDRDPFLLFELRGLERDELQKELEKTPLGQALAAAIGEQNAGFDSVDSYFTRAKTHPLAPRMTPGDFWHGCKRLPENLPSAVPASIPALLIKKGGDFPAFWSNDHSFIDAMEAIYQAIRKREKDW